MTSVMTDLGLCYTGLSHFLRLFSHVVFSPVSDRDSKGAMLTSSSTNFGSTGNVLDAKLLLMLPIGTMTQKRKP